MGDSLSNCFLQPQQPSDCRDSNAAGAGIADAGSSEMGSTGDKPATGGSGMAIRFEQTSLAIALSSVLAAVRIPGAHDIGIRSSKRIAVCGFNASERADLRSNLSFCGRDTMQACY